MPTQVEAPQDRYGSATSNDAGGATARFTQDAPAERSVPPAAQPADSEQPPARLPANADNPLRRMPLAPGSEVHHAPIGRLASNPPAAGALTSGEEGTGKPGQAQLEGAQSPSVTIEKFAPAEVQVGKPATFEILVRNVGQVRATDRDGPGSDPAQDAAGRHHRPKPSARRTAAWCGTSATWSRARSGP